MLEPLQMSVVLFSEHTRAVRAQEKEREENSTECEKKSRGACVCGIWCRYPDLLLTVKVKQMLQNAIHPSVKTHSIIPAGGLRILDLP